MKRKATHDDFGRVSSSARTDSPGIYYVYTIKNAYNHYNFYYLIRTNEYISKDIDKR